MMGDDNFRNRVLGKTATVKDGKVVKAGLLVLCAIGEEPGIVMEEMGQTDATFTSERHLEVARDFCRAAQTFRVAARPAQDAVGPRRLVVEVDSHICRRYAAVRSGRSSIPQMPPEQKEAR
jgi:hypothetical protein